MSPIVDLSGNRLPYAPRFTGDLHLDYRLPLQSLEQTVVVTFGGDAIIQSRVDFSAFNQPDLAQPGNTRYDLNLKAESPDHRLSLTGWVKNLTNELVYANKTVGGGTSTNRAIYGVVAPPRTYGVTAAFNF